MERTLVNGHANLPVIAYGSRAASVGCLVSAAGNGNSVLKDNGIFALNVGNGQAVFCSDSSYNTCFIIAQIGKADGNSLAKRAGVNGETVANSCKVGIFVASSKRIIYAKNNACKFAVATDKDTRATACI